MSVLNTIREELDGNAGLYGSMTDQQVADELNVIDKPRNRTSMSRNEVLDNIELSALDTLSGDNVTKVFGILSDSVDPFGPAVQVFKDAFGGESATITNLAIARTETVSQTIKMGIGNVSEQMINNARNL